MSCCVDNILKPLFLAHVARMQHNYVIFAPAQPSPDSCPIYRWEVGQMSPVSDHTNRFSRKPQFINEVTGKPVVYGHDTGSHTEDRRLDSCCKLGQDTALPGFH